MMGRFLAGSLSALLLAAAGIFWWQGHAPQGQAVVAAQPAPAAASDDSLPVGDPNAMDAAPPLPPSASPRTREERRFDHYDRDRDNIITRNEMMASRVRDFRKLDTDGNNLLSFEEWAAHTAVRFDTADADHDGKLTRVEFATTAPKRSNRSVAKCHEGSGKKL
jgi:hypothetical protein